MFKKSVFGSHKIDRIPIAINGYYAAFDKALSRGHVRVRTIAELNNPIESSLRFIEKYKENHNNFDLRFINPTICTTFAICDNNNLDLFIEPTKTLAGSRVLYTNIPRWLR